VTIDCRNDLILDTYPGTLSQVLTNLVMNALTHAYGDGQSGQLSLTVSEPSPNLVRIVFADDGKGMPPETVHRVFDPFFTTRRSHGSTGLGLHIVYNLVTGTLHGKIEVESAPGRGTRFTIDIPESIAEAAADRNLAGA
jgi:signal transduction histidine kinase